MSDAPDEREGMMSRLRAPVFRTHRFFSVKNRVGWGRWQASSMPKTADVQATSWDPPGTTETFEM
jgi:hypothetical protein